MFFFSGRSGILLVLYVKTSWSNFSERDRCRSLWRYERTLYRIMGGIFWVEGVCGDVHH